MNQLPSEIWTEIFILLDQNDKVECLTVCQYWNNVIKEFALYHTLYIFSAKSLKNVTSMIQNSLNGNKVEQLVLSLFNEKEHIDLNPLLLLLPNLRRFFCTGPEGQLLTSNKVTYPWQNSIEYIHELSLGSVTNQLLQQSECSKLARLIITDYHNDIIPLLKNAPGLKSLTLGNGRLNFMDLETIHKYTPHLDSITLRGIDLDDDTAVGSMSITPSLSVTECIFDELVTHQLESRKELVIYISKKYPNVSKVICTFYRHLDYDWDVSFDENLLPHLLQNTGSRLKYLYMNNQAFCKKNPFRTLDLYYCRIKTLKLQATNFLVQDRYDSQQFLHIENLSLKDAEVIKKFDDLKKFTMLKKLKLNGDKYIHRDWQMTLFNLPDQIPQTLKSLSLHTIGYPLAGNKNRVYPSIQSLSLALCSIKPGDSISRCFPNLNRLKIRSCDIPNGFLDLLSLDLFSFHFISNQDCIRDVYFPGEDDYLNRREHFDAFYGNDSNDYDGIENSILVITKKERRRYAKRKHTNSREMRFFRMYKMFNSQVISWPERESDPKPRFTFRFNSLKNIIFE